MSQIATLSLPSGRFQGDYQNLYPRKEEEVSGHHEKQRSVKFCYLIVWIASGWGQIYHNTQSFQPPQHINFTQGPEFGPNTFQLYHTLQQFSNPKTFFLLITYAFFIYSWNFPAPLQLHCQPLFSFLPGTQHSLLLYNHASQITYHYYTHFPQDSDFILCTEETGRGTQICFHHHMKSNVWAPKTKLEGGIFSTNSGD